MTCGVFDEGRTPPLGYRRKRSVRNVAAFIPLGLKYTAAKNRFFNWTIFYVYSLFRSLDCGG